MRPLAAVTGGTGFLGRHVTAAFAAAGWRLRLLVRKPDAAVPQGAETVLGSLADRQALGVLVEGADAVIHLAGLIRAPSRADFMAANRDGTTLLAAAWHDRAPGARFVLVSSLAAREPGLSSYAASKAAGEAALAAAGDGDTVILRPTVIYGPGDRATLGLFRAAGWLVQPVLNGPEARVALIHAADVASAVVAAARGAGDGKIPGGTWELTDARAEGYAWTEIVEAACRARGRTARPVRVPAGMLRLAARGADLAALAGWAPPLSSGKAREILHAGWGSRPEAQPPAVAWRPARDIESGFTETVAWYQAEGWLANGSRAPLRSAA